MNLLFDFTVDKSTSTIYLTREFAADLDLVWDAFTKPEILDQWMAPKPYRVQTKEMDFREGGRWLYAMHSPDAILGWSLAEFIKIEPKTSFTTKNSFSDENGNTKETGFTYSITKNSFEPGDAVTTVRIEKKMESLEQLEKFVAMGWQDGMNVAMKNLDEYLLTLAGTK